jgi:hypothetical protein
MTKPNGHDHLDPEHPPGLLGMLVDHGAQRTPFITRRPALAGALVGLATATRNLYVVQFGPANRCPLNVHAAVIGDTGSGKETALRYSTALSTSAGIEPAAFASDVGLHKAFAAKRHDGSDPKVQILVMDEWGHALRQMKNDKAGHQRGVMVKCMECHGLATGDTLKARHYADSKNNVPAVHNPFLCAIFATTKSTLLDGLSSADVVDGSLNRIVPVLLEQAPAPRPLHEIVTGPYPKT